MTASPALPCSTDLVLRGDLPLRIHQSIEPLEGLAATATGKQPKNPLRQLATAQAQEAT